MHSFMFISSYEDLRRDVRNQAAIEAMAHCGPGLFEVGNPGTLQTTAFALRKEPEAKARENQVGTYFRLVYAPNSYEKQMAFEQALREKNLTYHLVQYVFNAIPGAPWVYWISNELRDLFTTLPLLGEVAKPRQGLATSDNFRFLRCWWEVGRSEILFDCRSHEESQQRRERWYPYMKGGGYRKWYGNQEHVINWRQDGVELKAWAAHKYVSWSRTIKNVAFYFKEGVTYSYLTSASFSARYLPPGFVFDVAGSSIFPSNSKQTLKLVSILNSQWAQYALKLINPTVNFQVGDLKRLPIYPDPSRYLKGLVVRAVLHQYAGELVRETTFSFVTPLSWSAGINHFTATRVQLATLEAQTNGEVYHLYGISDEDRAAIEAELAGGTVADEDEDAVPIEDEEEAEPEPPMTVEELAVRWISYAIGVVLGRFQPGVPGALGSAVYRREDFAVGSLSAPDKAEFDQLVGPVERFATVDDEGGRHLFPAEVEVALQNLALPDGIAVLDKGHARDLPALVEKALALMWGAEAAQEIIGKGAAGDLRRFLEHDFFTKWHLKWYRQRPVYWPLQSARRSYGFVLFHERVDRATLYVLQRDYLDHKLNGLQLRIGDLQAQLEGKEGRARKQVEREIDQTAQLLDEIAEFATTMERIVRAGYEPEPNWIDDGVILRMAPLWELVPIWKREPKKYWERLQRGDYDWSHIAMRYWPKRVREACRVNKSFAIAHGHEGWYEGD